MGFNEFRAKIRDTGLPLSNHYVVTIGGDIDNSMSLLTDSVTLPGITLMTQEMRTFGEIQETPYGIIYDPVSFSVIVDNTAGAKVFFDDWADQVFDRDSRMSGYLKEYAREVQIDMIDRSKAHGKIYGVTLYEAYPKSIEAITLSNGNSDIVKLNVTLSYRYWSTRSAAESVNTGDNIFEEIMNNYAFLANKDTYFGASQAFDLRDWGPVNNFPIELSKYGGEISSSCGRSISNVTRQLYSNPATNSLINLQGTDGQNKAGGLLSGLNNLTSNINSFGAGLTDLSKNLTAVAAPVAAISGAVGSISGTLGSIDSTLSALGIPPAFTGVRNNLNATAGKLATVSNLAGLPKNILSVGANMTSMGTQFKKVSESMKKVPGSTQKLTDSLNKLGFNLEKQGTNTSNSSNVMQSYSDTHP